VAVLMHASLTATTRITPPSTMAGLPLLVFDLTWAAPVSGVAAVAIRSRKR